MGGLIKFPEIHRKDDGLNTVNARDLWEFLGVQTRFNDWVKVRVEECQFIEGADYATITENLVNGGRRIEYHLTLEAAKHFSMMERSEKGKQARQYFIDCEKKLKSAANDLQVIMVNNLVKLRELSESIVTQVNSGFLEVNNRLDNHDERLKNLETQKRRNPSKEDQRWILETIFHRFHRYCPMCGKVLILDQSVKPNKNFNWEHKENPAWAALNQVWATCSDCNQNRRLGRLDPEKVNIRFSNFHIELQDYKSAFPTQLSMLSVKRDANRLTQIGT
jgi:phage anti-repressor protein